MSFLMKKTPSLAHYSVLLVKPTVMSVLITGIMAAVLMTLNACSVVKPSSGAVYSSGNLDIDIKIEALLERMTLAVAEPARPI